MPYVIRIGPYAPASGEAKYSYVALANEVDTEGVHAEEVAADDDAGLRALQEKLEGLPLVCEPRLAAAAAKAGLACGDPVEPELTEWWRQGLTLATRIGNLLEGVNDLERVVDFALACSAFEGAREALKPHVLSPFALEITGAVAHRAVGRAVATDEDLAFTLYPDRASLERSDRLSCAGLFEESMGKLTVTGVVTDQNELPTYLADAVEWASLDRLYLPMKIVDGSVARLTASELLVLTGTLQALSELGDGTRATAEVSVGDDEISVALTLLPEVELATNILAKGVRA